MAEIPVTHEEHAKFGVLARREFKWGLHFSTPMRVEAYSHFDPPFREPVLVFVEGDDLWLVNKARWEQLKELAKEAGLE